MEPSTRTPSVPSLRTAAFMALASFALLPTAVGCSGDDGQPESSSQDLRQSPCNASEIDPLVACSAEPCEGLAGDPLMECMDQNCPESIWDVTETCATCIIGNQSSVEAIAAGCGPTQQPGSACSASEFDPIAACAAEPCDGLAGDALMQCMGESCPESVWEISPMCAHCLGANQSSLDAMAGACGEGAEPFVSCSAEEVDPITACAVEPCAGIAGDPLMECMDQNCPESIWEVSETCATCMLANQSSVEDMTGNCGGPAPEPEN